jgi:hypothetical protein
MSALPTPLSLPISPRINQLDAAMLDNEITLHLADQLKYALAYIPLHHFDVSTSTITAAAEVMFLLFTTGRQLPTPGQSMLYASGHTYHTSLVARHTSHVTHHTSHVTRHTSHVIHCMRHFTCQTPQITLLALLLCVL